MGKQRVAPVAGADRDPRYHARPGLRWLPHVSVCQRTARDDRRAASLARHDLQGGDLRTALWRRRSTPCLSPIAPRTSSLSGAGLAVSTIWAETSSSFSERER